MTEEEIALIEILVKDFIQKFFNQIKNIPDLTSIQIHGNFAIVTFLDKGQIKNLSFKMKDGTQHPIFVH